MSPIPNTVSKINSKWKIKTIYNAKTIKLFEENKEEHLYAIGFGGHFSIMTPKAKATKKRPPTYWEKIFVIHIT